MLSYILRRIASTLPVMAIVALFVFSLLYIAPGDPAVVIAGDQASPEDVERIRQSLGLDRPFLVQFGGWVWRILHGDLGTSIFTNLPVSHMIAQRIEPTLSLMLLTIVFSIIVAIPPPSSPAIRRRRPTSSASAPRSVLIGRSWSASANGCGRSCTATSARRSSPTCR